MASGSLEFAVLVTGFVVQTLSHELLVQDMSHQNDDLSGIGGSSAVGAAGQLQKQLSHQLALFQGQQQQQNGGDDSRIKELKAQVQV